MMSRLFFSAVAVAASGFAAPTLAADCPIDVESSFDLDETQIAAVYDCLKDEMVKAYTKEGNEIAAAYRDWTVAGTRPAVAGPHGERLLLTFANDIAADQYLAFAEEGVNMPAGSILAKESISISKKKKQARVGPLFLMTKLENGASPDTNDWLYEGVQPNGKPMKFKQSFCHDCHSGWAEQDDLAYPIEEVRVTK